MACSIYVFIFTEKQIVLLKRYAKRAKNMFKMLQLNEHLISF